MAATSRGWEKYGSPDSALLVPVRLHGVDIGAIEQRLVGARVVLLDPLDKLVLAHHATPRGVWLGADVMAPLLGRARTPALRAASDVRTASGRRGREPPTAIAAAIGGRLGRRQALHAASSCSSVMTSTTVSLDLVVAPEHRACGPAAASARRRARARRPRRSSGSSGSALRACRRRDGLLGDLAQRDHGVLVVFGVDRDVRAVGNRLWPGAPPAAPARTGLEPCRRSLRRSRAPCDDPSSLNANGSGPGTDAPRPCLISVRLFARGGHEIKGLRTT